MASEVAPNSSPTAVVLNPRSGGGRTGEVWARIRPQLEEACGPVHVCATRSPGHGIDLTREAVRSGFRRVIAVGGDGTLNEVVNGVMAFGEKLSTEIALIPQGTGSDFRRTLGVGLDEDLAIDTIREGRTSLIDVMKVVYTSADGGRATRYALNVMSFGMGGRVAARANRSSKPFGAKATFLAATLVTALGYKGDRVTVQLDETRIPDTRITNVAVGNGQYHGAGMRVCPAARIDDGLLDVTIVDKLSLWQLVTGCRYLFNGRIAEHPAVQVHRTTRCSAEALESKSAIEIDGEALGHLPVQIEVIPRAIRMIVPEWPELQTSSGSRIPHG